jgi:DNA (cytosine-5)-methyltransferase 1
VTAVLRQRPVSFGEGWQRSRGGLFVPEQTAAVRSRPIGIGLFVGAGGFDLGFTQAGFHMAAAVEYDRAAAATYLANLGGPATVVHGPDGIIPNTGDPFGTGWIASEGCAVCPFRDEHEQRATERESYYCVGCHWKAERCCCARCVAARPCEHFWLGDIRGVSGYDILDALGLAVGEVDVVIGGPPCQGYSMAGKREVMDPRNSLVFEFGRIVREVQPKTFVMENVVGIATMVTPEGVPVIEALARQITADGYGDFLALRRALAQQAGVGVGTGFKPARGQADDESDDVDVQLDLFAGATP